MEINDPSIGFYCLGVTYLLHERGIPAVFVPETWMVWPLPKKLIAVFFKKG